MSYRSFLFRWRLAVFASKRVSWRAKLTAYTLSHFMDNETGECDPGVRTIADRAGASDSTVRRGTTELQSHGYLVVFRQHGRMTEHGRTNVYKALLPDWAVDEDEW